MKPATSNVRVSSRTHALLSQLAEEANESMQAILDKAVERYRRESFLRAANRDFAALKRNPKAWKEELRERLVWEQTLADGLDRK
jgi:predicted transcriptional regulator